MTPLSGLPNQFTLTQIGKVSNKAIPEKSHAAKYLPSTVSVVDTGNVIKISIVPDLRSSAHKRIAMAGINIM